MLAKDVFINPSKIILKDGNKKDENNMFYGGISYIDETLDNFLAEIELDFYKINVLELLNKLDECNILIDNLKGALKW